MPTSATLARSTARRAALAAVALALPALAAACEGGGESLSIDSASWRAEPEPRVVVSGGWRPGVFTPPACVLLEGRKGEPSDWYDASDRVELNGGEFRREFVRDPQAGDAALDSSAEYFVRCRVSGSTGKSVDATAPVAGEPPVSLSQRR